MFLSARLLHDLVCVDEMTGVEKVAPAGALVLVNAYEIENLPRDGQIWVSPSVCPGVPSVYSGRVSSDDIEIQRGR